MPRQRRGSGEGSIYQRQSDGRWVASVDLGAVGGKRRRKPVYGKTRKDVVEKLKALHRQQHEGTLRASDKTTLGSYLADWLDTAHTTRRGTTVEHYRYLVDTYIIPKLGGIRLDRLTSDDVTALLAELVSAGHPPTARQVRQILIRALNDAARRKKLAYNVALATDPPSHTARAPYVLSDDEARALLKAAEGDRFGIAVQLGLLLGMRRGEISAARWSDIDWGHRTITIQRTAKRSKGKGRHTNPPKTKNAIRTLPLVAGLEDALRLHRTAQDEEFALKGIENTDDLIIATQAGTQYDTPNYLRAFRRLLAAADLPPAAIRPHDLRHSTASLLIDAGVDPRTVANILGHASTATTMEIYTRGQQTDRRPALEKLATRLKSE